MVVFVRTTAAGVITHSATMTADTPDTDLSNNSTAVETNMAVSLASFTLTPPTVIGGRELSLGHVALTNTRAAWARRWSRSPAAIRQIASVPSSFAVLGGCCDNGKWREFYVTTQPVSTTTTVEITATYGLVTRVVPLTIAPAGVATPYSGAATPLPGVLQAEDFDVGGEGVPITTAIEGTTAARIARRTSTSRTPSTSAVERTSDGSAPASGSHTPSTSPRPASTRWTHA